MTEWGLYWLLMLDGIHVFAITFASVFSIGVLGFLIAWIVALDERNREEIHHFIINVFKWLIPLYVMLLLAAVLVPTTKQMAVIIAVPKIVNAIEGNKELMQLPNNIVNLANEWINELKPDTSKGN